MDHLPLIEDPAYPLPHVPCHCDVSDFDGHGMAGFPERVGWRIDREEGPVRSDPSKSSISTPEALLQAWLFIGLLHNVFSAGETEIDLTLFQQQVNGQTVLSTVALRESLDRLAENSSGHSSDTYLDRHGRVKDGFSAMQNFLNRHLFAQTARQNWVLSSLLSLDQIFVFLILAETLKNAILQLWPVPLMKSSKTWFAIKLGHIGIKDRLLEFGWCPSEASLLDEELDYTGLFIASMLKRSFSTKLDHRKCDDQRCLALQISEDAYKTKHAEGCASCEELAVDQEEVAGILRGGGNPIVLVLPPREGEAKPRLRVLDFNANSISYFAISHVWAHGLGNPHANALPMCQLSRLRELVIRQDFMMNRVVGRQPAFWIDTLCIPVGSKFKPERKLAITRLDNTFREAKQVLALDADLESCSIHFSRTELATRLLCSGWMRRLWTLAEAVVSKELSNAAKVDVQFFQRSIELNSLAGSKINTIYHTDAALFGVFGALPQYRSRDRAFATLTRALKHRTTSKQEDEAICLASILGLGRKNIAVIASASTAEERMHLLYTLIEQLPASVLFHRSKSLENGFSWAPASLLGGLSISSFEGPAATCDAQGLHAPFSGYLVTQPKPRSGWPSKPNVQGYYLDNVEDDTTKLFIMDSGGNMRNPTAKSNLEAALKLDAFMNSADTPAFIVNTATQYNSALVSVSGEEGGVIFAKYDSLISISTRKLWELPKDWRDRLITARPVSPQQMWCIT